MVEWNWVLAKVCKILNLALRTANASRTYKDLVSTQAVNKSIATDAYQMLAPS